MIDEIDFSLYSFDEINLLKEHLILPITKDKVAFYKNDKDFINSLFFEDKEIVILPKDEIKYLLKEYERISYIYFVKSDINKFVDNLLSFAIDKKSSDIHIELYKNQTIIRFRIDGVLKTFFKLEKGFLNKISSILKLYSNIDISLSRLPQDGSFVKTINNQKFDFRLSTMPTLESESIVIRILYQDRFQINLDDIGLDSLDIIKKNIKKTSGLVLVTGPTGSGKTTTLYSMLRYINDNTKKIITIENPIEAKIDGITQVQVNFDIGLDFDLVLKNILRQDPDIIMIGEIRDKHTLETAIRASLTGHLVFATLHTTNTINTIDRIIDLGIEPFLVSSSLKLIISLRLVKNLCFNCKEKLNNYYAKGKGCSKCNFTGFVSRQIINETLEVDNSIKNFINKKQTLEIKNYLQQNNFKFLSDVLKEKINNFEVDYFELEVF